MPHPLVVVLLLAGASLAAANSLTYDVPGGWASREPRSSMRIAEFTLPRAQGDAEDADLVIYFFGGSGGSVEANLDRWIGQMTQPDGRSSREAARTSTFTANGLDITLVDVPGTYVADVSPGSTERHNKPGFRLQAAIIQTPDGPYFVKLVGPAKTVARWGDSMAAFLKSMRHAFAHSSTGTPEGLRPILVRNTPVRMAAAPAIVPPVIGSRSHTAAKPSAARGVTFE